MWVVSRGRYERTRALYEEQAEKTRDAERDRDASVAVSARTARLHAEADAALTRVNGRNRRLAELLVDEDRVPRRRLRIARMAAARLLIAYVAEKRRADLLQLRLDDAVGLNHPGIREGAGWQRRRQDKPIVAKESRS